MRTIAGEEYMDMKECVAFLGMSRSTIAKNIAMTKKKLLEPPFPYLAPIGGKARMRYFFSKKALENWINMRSVG